MMIAANVPKLITSHIYSKPDRLKFVESDGVSGTCKISMYRASVSKYSKAAAFIITLNKFFTRAGIGTLTNGRSTISWSWFTKSQISLKVPWIRFYATQAPVTAMIVSLCSSSTIPLSKFLWLPICCGSSIFNSVSYSIGILLLLLRNSLFFLNFISNVSGSYKAETSPGWLKWRFMSRKSPMYSVIVQLNYRCL